MKSFPIDPRWDAFRDAQERQLGVKKRFELLFFVTLR